MSKTAAVASLAALVLLAGCKTGFNRTHSQPKDPNPPPCAKEASNPNVSNEARAVFKMLAGFTCSDSPFDGYVMGQNAGSGNQIAIDSHDRSYAKLITAVDTATTHLPGMVAIDYEHDRIFTVAQLKSANEKLEAHWNEGGLVSISWMPLNPWKNDAQDPVSTPGTAADLLAGDERHDLADLLDDSTDVYEVWRRKLDHVAEALQDLEAKGVAVLWRPLPEMNTERFWWGTFNNRVTNNVDDASLYTDLWEDMYEYLTKDKELSNLLWVYSPGESGTPNGKNATWAYPGADFVDVVAGIARNDALNIKDYQVLIDLQRPFGMAEYSPLPAEKGGVDSASPKMFNALTYADRLHGSYKAAGFWVSWHSYDASQDGEDVRSHMALIDSDHLKALTDRAHILSVERIKEHKLRD